MSCCIAANHEILVLNVPMTAFEALIGDLSALLTLIKQQTGKVFIPITVTQSPVAPKEQFIIVLRTTENVQTFSLDGWFTDNIPVLVKKFVTKTIKIDTELSGGSISNKLTLKLKQLNA